MRSSRAGIDHPSPQNVYNEDWLKSGYMAEPSCRVRLKRRTLLRGRCVSRSPRRVLFAIPKHLRSLTRFSSELPVVGGGTEQDIHFGNGIIPTTDRTFLSRVHDPPGGAGCYRMSCRRTKKSDLPFYLFRGRKRTPPASRYRFRLFQATQNVLCCCALSLPSPIDKR